MNSLLTQSRNAIFNSSGVVMHRAGDRAGTTATEDDGSDAARTSQLHIANESLQAAPHGFGTKPEPEAWGRRVVQQALRSEFSAGLDLRPERSSPRRPSQKHSKYLY